MSGHMIHRQMWSRHMTAESREQSACTFLFSQVSYKDQSWHMSIDGSRIQRRRRHVLSYSLIISTWGWNFA